MIQAMLSGMEPQQVKLMVTQPMNKILFNKQGGQHEVMERDVISCLHFAAKKGHIDVLQVSITIITYNM